MLHAVITGNPRAFIPPPIGTPGTIFCAVATMPLPKELARGFNYGPDDRKKPGFDAYAGLCHKCRNQCRE